MHDLCIFIALLCFCLLLKLASLTCFLSFAAGNLRHLIVEACIARNVLDTSAYMWPGYVKGHCSQIPRNIPGQVPGWPSFMKGSPLTPPMVNTLVSTPATR